MFAIEQYELKKVKIQARKGFYKAGMTLEQPQAMKRKFTYRELTLLIGILVAVIIAATVMMDQITDQQVFNNYHELPLPLISRESSSIKELIIGAIF
ncbi:MAG TPA: hypothetical protein VGK59_13915 [Ohtaekwangia sp.]